MTRHIELFWNVDFKKETISGEAILHFNIVAKEIEHIVSVFFVLFNTVKADTVIVNNCMTHL